MTEFSTKKGAAALALVSIIGLMALKSVVAFLTGSVSVLAQLADSFLDMFAVSLSFLAVAMAARPADEEHPFGHGKIENISAIIQAGLLFAAAGSIVYVAVKRILRGEEVAFTESGIGVMIVSVTASFFLSRHLRRVSRNTGSPALGAIARNIAADVYSAAGVLVGMVVIRFTGFIILDPVIALLVVGLIARSGYKVMKGSFGGLVDAKLPPGEEEMIISAITEHASQVIGFHEMRTRMAGSQRFVDLHLVMPKNVSVEKAHQMCDHLEEDLKTRLGDVSVTIHVEPCGSDCALCQVAGCSVRLNIGRPANG